jgi:hypothetical protein
MCLTGAHQVSFSELLRNTRGRVCMRTGANGPTDNGSRSPRPLTTTMAVFHIATGQDRGSLSLRSRYGAPKSSASGMPTARKTPSANLGWTHPSLLRSRSPDPRTPSLCLTLLSGLVPSRFCRQERVFRTLLESVDLPALCSEKSKARNRHFERVSGLSVGSPNGIRTSYKGCRRMSHPQKQRRSRHFVSPSSTNYRQLGRTLGRTFGSSDWPRKDWLPCATPAPGYVSPEQPSGGSSR